MRLCIDSLVAYPDNSLVKLRDKDTLSIAYHTTGCFHDFSNRIVITRTGPQLEARLYGKTRMPGDTVRDLIVPLKKDTLLKVRTLTENDILPFIRFENELRKFTGRNGFYVLNKSWFGAD